MEQTKLIIQTHQLHKIQEFHTQFNLSIISKKNLTVKTQKYIFLNCRCFWCPPPISKLTAGQAMYHFISGYTAKVAGTEDGIEELQTTFSACFGAPFMPLHPTKYAEMLGKKMKEFGVNVWLINTGWSGGEYGEGSRISLNHTRAMISAALNNKLNDVEYSTHEVFGLHMPKSCPEVPSEII